MPGNKKIEDLMNKPMDRRGFLRNVGLMIVSIIGVNKAFHVLSSGSLDETHKSSNGYGKSKYGT